MTAAAHSILQAQIEVAAQHLLMFTVPCQTLLLHLGPIDAQPLLKEGAHPVPRRWKHALPWEKGPEKITTQRHIYIRWKKVSFDQKFSKTTFFDQTLKKGLKNHMFIRFFDLTLKSRSIWPQIIKVTFTLVFMIKLWKYMLFDLNWSKSNLHYILGSNHENRLEIIKIT